MARTYDYHEIARKAPRHNSQVWGFFVSIAVMAVISVAFFYPDNFDGTSLRQADMQQGLANGHEAEVYYEATGEKALWTNRRIELLSKV